MGRAIARRLSENGFAIAGVAIDRPGLNEVERAIKTAGGSFLTVECDLADPVAIARAFEVIDAEISGPDALVNNAGTCFMGEFPDIAPDELDRQMAINNYRERCYLALSSANEESQSTKVA